MAVCTYIVSKDIQGNCSNPIFGGLEQIGYLINRGDIASFTKTSGIVSAIALKTGAKAVTVQQMGQQAFNGTSAELQQGDVMNTFNKVGSFIILDNSPDVTEKIVNPLANGEFVLILENKYKDSTSKNAFEIIGLDRGCRATAITQNKYENMGGWQVELTETETPNASTFFWDTDYATSKAALEALLIPAV